jgi:hypothetical protein
MPGRVPGITSFGFCGKKNVDGRDKPGHDEHESISSERQRRVDQPVARVSQNNANEWASAHRCCN